MMPRVQSVQALCKPLCKGGTSPYAPFRGLGTTQHRAATCAMQVQRKVQAVTPHVHPSPPQSRPPEHDMMRDDRPDDGTEDFDERCDGTESCDCDECADDDPDTHGNCHWCGGDGYRECSHPLECTRRHTADGLCSCSSCGGSGHAKDMVIW